MNLDSAFIGLFKLMKKKGLLNQEEFDDLKNSMYGMSASMFLDVIDTICKDGD